jgi:CheY-like chemotaxis protein
LARTVLLADDSVTAQNMGRRILTDAGYEVITVNNGSAALKKIHESRPDLIVLDVYMPGYGGLEVCQRLKESEATQRIPVLLTVGKMEPFKTEEAKRVRADGHIIKPFDASELLAALTKLEDRIVPQSENGRGRGKSERKSRRWGAAEDPAKANDLSRADQVAYLQGVKTRQATSPDDPEQTGRRQEAEFEADSQDAAEQAVTFAAGPIYQPSSAPEFQVNGESSSEPQASQSTAPAAESNITDGKPQPAPDHAEPAEEEISEASAAPVEELPAEKTESGPRWIAENVALTPEEASCSLDEEMRRAQGVDSEQPAPQEPAVPEAAADSAPQASAASEATEVSATEQDREAAAEEAVEPDHSQGAAFAAAASTSGSAVSGQSLSTDATDSESPTSSETAAAWDNWEKIRDSVVGPKLPESLVQSVTEMAQRSFAEEQASQPEPRSTPEPVEASEPAKSAEAAQSAEPPAQPSSGDALSSIVDTVLAELKPRLLAEIAKQLSNDKK